MPIAHQPCMDVIAHLVVLLLEARVRDAGHHRELLVCVGQAPVELDQVVQCRDAVEFTAHQQGGGADPGRVYHRQFRTHVDVGARRHLVVERQDRVGEGFDRRLVGAARMVAVEDRMHEGAVDRAFLDGDEIGQLLLTLCEGRGAFAGPDERVEGQARHPLGIALGEHRRAQRAGGYAVDHELLRAAGLHDVVAGRLHVVGAVGDIEIDVARLVGSAVAFHVDAPVVEATPGEPVHHGGVRATRDGQVEGRGRGHRRTVNPEDRAVAAGARNGALLPQVQVDVALLRPVLLAGNGGFGRAHR